MFTNVLECFGQTIYTFNRSGLSLCGKGSALSGTWGLWSCSSWARKLTAGVGRPVPCLEPQGTRECAPWPLLPPLHMTRQDMKKMGTWAVVGHFPPPLPWHYSSRLPSAPKKVPKAASSNIAVTRHEAATAESMALQELHIHTASTAQPVKDTQEEPAQAYAHEAPTSRRGVAGARGTAGSRQTAVWEWRG